MKKPAKYRLITKAKEEIATLFELARDADESLARSYVRKARRLAEAHRLSLREYNRLHCRKCCSYLGNLKIRNTRTSVTYTCDRCGFVRRVPKKNPVLGMGAEAVVTRIPKGVMKNRVKKRYRHVDLDNKLRLQRTKAEARLIERARNAGVPVPKIIEQRNTILIMSHIAGCQVKDILDENVDLLERIGEFVAKLHDANVIHGDLTTSNILHSKDEIVFIDFGLGYYSERIEDKAVDLHVMKEALSSRHHRIYSLGIRKFLKGYRSSKNAEAVIDRLRKVELRGKNKKGS